MGKWAPNQRADITDIREKAKLLLSDARQAKKVHRESKQCERTAGGSPDRACCGCHFWAGSIAALEELI